MHAWGSALVRSGVIARLFNSKPIWAQLKITEKCNLNCAYCTEHLKNGRHVKKQVVEAWLDHCSKLGVKHVEFIGGEPLLHPDLIQFLHYAKRHKMNTGLTTNGYLLTETTAKDLIDAGISRLQISIDSIEPNEITKKAVSCMNTQIELISDMDIWVHINSVLSEATVSQAKELAAIFFERGISVAFSPAHKNGKLSDIDENGAMSEFFEWLSIKKNEGHPVNMPHFLIDYFRKQIDGDCIEWRCEGGCKAFYVDSGGIFCYCSHRSTGIPFLKVDNKVLHKNHFRKKGCEENCGVSCMITNSFPFCQIGNVVRSDLLPGRKDTFNRSSGG